MTDKSDKRREVQKSPSEWKAILTSTQFHVTREAGTERAFTGQYWNTKEAGTYRCVCCDTPLFTSRAKYDSGCGWPSFYDGAKDAIELDVDYKLGYPRTEILCKRCGAHLGHVFEDGPRPTGLRYCVNSASLKFEPSEPASAR